MTCQAKQLTKYFRSAVAAQNNMGIDFKEDKFYILNPEELLSGKINIDICESIFQEVKKNINEDENGVNKNTITNVVICAKTIKTIFAANEKFQDEIEELTGVFYIPAILNVEGMLSFDNGNKKLPWFPREYLQPMIEPKLAIGRAEEVDKFISNHVDQVEKIETWSDYAKFFKQFYEAVTDSEFD